MSESSQRANASLARYNPWARRVFDYFVLRMARRDFSAIRLIGPWQRPASGNRILFVANHASWWDGLLLLLLQHFQLPHVPVYSVMLAREFDHTFWFRWIGCLPITPGEISSIRHLLTKLKTLRQDHQAGGFVCSFFPQGEIKPSFVRPLGFKPGLASVAAALAPVTVIPIGIHIEPMMRRKPEVFLVVGEPMEHAAGKLAIAPVEAAVTACLDRLFVALNRYGEHVFEEPDRLPHVQLV